MQVQDPKMTLVAKRLLRIPRIATLVAAVLVVGVLYATLNDTHADSRQNSTFSDSSQDSIQADIGRENLKHRIPRLQLAQTTPAILHAPRQTGEAVFFLELNNSILQGYADSVAFSPNDDVLAVVMKIRDERLVRIFDTSNWEPVAEFGIEKGNIFESRFSADGRFLVLAGYLDGVAVYDREYAWRRFSVDVHEDEVHDFAFVPGEGNTIATASRDGRACIVNLEAPCAASRCFHYVRENGNKDPLFSVAVSQDGQEIATGSLYGVIYRWNIRDNSTPLWTSSPYTDHIYDLEYSQEDDLLIAAVDKQGIFGIPISSQRNSVIFPDSGYQPFIQLNSSGKRVFALVQSGLHDTLIISYSIPTAAPVFSFSADSYFTHRKTGTRVTPRSIYGFEVSTSNRYIALAGKNLLVVELQ